MFRTAYKLLLRAPQFKGRHRIEAVVRRVLAPRPDRTAHGLLMHLDIQEWAQISMLSGWPHEPVTTRLIETLLQPGDTFIDVGAHVGWFSLEAARRVGPSGRVIAIDPQPYNCERTMSNAMLNGLDNILVVPAALSDTDGFTIVHQQSARDKARFTLAGPGVNDTNFRFLCALTRLDSLLTRLGIGAAKLIKIDVEGFERHVLSGAGDALQHIENVILEVLPDTAADDTVVVTGFLQQAGFQVSQVDGAPWNMGDRAIEDNVWWKRM